MSEKWLEAVKGTGKNRLNRETSRQICLDVESF